MTKLFSGTYTAIITPFKEDKSIDWKAFDKLVALQIEAGVSGIVPCGTTGESPTLSDEEQQEMIKRVVDKVGGACQVIAGAGSNNTSHAVHLAKQAEASGADACMIVNPYYNKPTQEGLFLHFKEVAEAISIPVVVYSIKGRTGVNVETSTLLRLIETCPNIRAVKEASGDISQMKEVIAKTDDSFAVLSGDDPMTLELIRAGGDGVISVVSNLVPDRIVALTTTALSGDFESAQDINDELNPLFAGAFVETNPIPIKAANVMRGLCLEEYRLPMCPMRPENRERWETTLKGLSLLG